MSTDAAATEKDQISLTTSDNAVMSVPRKVAERSILIKNLLEDLGGETSESIPIPNVCTPPLRLLP
jgi:S-phase kinase-associated protein 1